MKRPTYEEFATKQGLEKKSQENGKVELFLITKCPTPGCTGRKVRPIMKLGRVHGFTCDRGCEYSSKRNKFSGGIDYFELLKFNHYFVDPGITGFRVKHDGTPRFDWY